MNCKQCDSPNLYQERKNEKQIGEYCRDCGAWQRWVPWDKPRFYIGQYAGRAIDEIQDYGYLQWAYKNMKLSKKQLSAIVEQSAKITNRGK